MKEPWIPLADYCEKYNERRGTIHKRLQDGTWERGVHYSAPSTGEAYVHEQRARTWLEQHGKLDLQPE